MLEPWNLLVVAVVGLVSQAAVSFEAGRAIGAAECRAQVAQMQPTPRRERPMASPRQPEMGNRRY